MCSKELKPLGFGSNNRRKNLQHTSHCNIDLAGLVCRKTCFSVSVDLINYVLLQRDQIPQSYESLILKSTANQHVITEKQLKANFEQNNQIINHIKSNNHNDNDGANSSPGLPSSSHHHAGSDALITTQNCGTNIHSQSHSRFQSNSFSSNNNRQQDEVLQCEDRCLQPLNLKKISSSLVCRPSLVSTRKKIKSIESAKLVFDHLRVAFEHATFPVHKLAFSLGSSLVNPKETFVISFPQNHMEGKDVSCDVKKILFRKLVTSDFIESFSRPGFTYGIQKLFVLLLANRNSDITWFIPQARYTLPKRGSIYYINLTNPEAVNTSVCVSDNTLLNISGVNPMEESFDNLELCSPCPTTSKRRRLGNVSYEEQCDLEDLIWYQSPISFCGFK